MSDKTLEERIAELEKKLDALKAAQPQLVPYPVPQYVPPAYPGPGSYPFWYWQPTLWCSTGGGLAAT